MTRHTEAFLSMDSVCWLTNRSSTVITIHPLYDYMKRSEGVIEIQTTQCHFSSS